MYLRITKRRNKDGTEVRYYQLAENVWNAERGHAIAKVVYNFGRADELDHDGLRRLAGHLHPAGVFAMWSDDPPDPEFRSVLATVFASTEAHIVTFPNHLTGAESANTVYVATGGPAKPDG